MTLDELMKIHPPGTKFSHNSWAPPYYFECWFRLNNGMWYGKNKSSSIDYHPGDGLDSWTHWQPPKKKKKMWLWARPPDPNMTNLWGYGWRTSGSFFAEHDVEGWIKIPGTEIEVDE